MHYDRHYVSLTIERQYLFLYYLLRVPLPVFFVMDHFHFLIFHFLSYCIIPLLIQFFFLIILAFAITIPLVVSFGIPAVGDIAAAVVAVVVACVEE